MPEPVRAGSFKRCQTSITWCCSADPALGAQDGFALHAKAGTDADTADKAAKAMRKNVNTSSILLAQRANRTLLYVYSLITLVPSPQIQIREYWNATNGKAFLAEQILTYVPAGKPA
ncbi:hypothetical protein PI126_g24284 [Phytophthora idaei]|nr:hypothetical protein PI126_g24284 [Phytophthora idaei]